VEQFSDMPLKDQYRPSGEELVLVQVGFGQSKVYQKMVWVGPRSSTGLTTRIAYGLVAFFHSSSVKTPFLISN
jgi:hypothetical protein